MALIELLVLRMNSNPCVKLDSADTRVMVIDLIVALFDPNVESSTCYLYTQVKQVHCICSSW